MAEHHVSVDSSPAARRLIARLAVAAAALAVLVAAVIVLAGMEARHDGPRVAAGSDARAVRREKDMARLARWREIRRQARACGSRSGTVESPCAPLHGDVARRDPSSQK
jgi:hypothetical protein